MKTHILLILLLLASTALYSQTVASGGIISTPNNAKDLKLRTNTTTTNRVIILDAAPNNMGINIDLPLEKLHLVGSMRADRYNNTTGIFSSIGATDLTFYTGALSTNGTGGTVWATIKNTNGFMGIGTAVGSITERLHVTGNTRTSGNFISDGGILNVNSSTNPFVIQANGTTRVTVLNSGQVGIGSSITAPTEFLHVGGNTRTTGNFISDGGIFNVNNATNPFSLQTNGTTRMTILSSGKVGIGNAAPAEFLHVTGNTRTTGNFITDAGTFNVNNATNPLLLQTNGTTRMTILSSGQVGIGTNLTTNPNGYMLAVSGKIGAKDIQVERASTTWPDYVFGKAYQLPSLYEVEKYIEENNHLKEVPSAETVGKDGYSVGDLNEVLLKKVEELTLYVIAQQKEIDALKEQMNKRKNR